MKKLNRNQLVKTRKVAITGFSGPSLAMLEYCFSSAVDCELVTLSAASIVVVNGDQAQKEEDLQSQIKEKNPTSQYIVISARDLSWPGFTLLKKPHSSSDLLEIVRKFEIDESELADENSESEATPENSVLDKENLDYYRGGLYSRKRKGEALKQKLIRGNLVVNAADRLVQQVEADLKAQEAQLQEQLKAEQEKHDAIIKKKEQIRELKLKKIAAKKKQLEEQKQKKKKLELQKKKLAAIQKAKLKAAKEKQKAKEASVTEPSAVEKPSAVKEPSAVPVKKYAKELTAEQILQCCGNAADVNFARPDERRSVFHNPEGSLLVVLSDAIELAQKQEQPVEVTGLPGQLFVFPENREIYSTFSDDFLNQLALTRFGYGELGFEEKTDFELKEKDKHLVEGVDSFVWKVAIWTARGRLIVGMDPEKTMQLTTKPDFDAFLPLPHGEEISEVWAGNSLSALDVAKILDVPQRVVFAYMCGAYSLGWFQV
ncbi:hypothetical protein [Neptuniibacter caesariensis]|uniref:Uncharacterized protein n=1 Tax=Neptuniibacter caesariensis TaxID=207954 RepID=A0A7U8GRR1_NEPCE|nr:hypothetical protein [Neptuniibacter caesariensis]EAR60611.1 hypothetical protein MED92_09411 [Oceanospirillum sp. MED92] [Neptuniibacter caesariensis]